MMTKKIAVALSGGVDSSLVLHILKTNGYDVHAFTMMLNDDDVEAAKTVANFLDVPHTIIDMRDEFKNEIIKYFLDSYEKGLTPSPCLVCNRKIKFGRLFEEAQKIGFEFMATGHYAKIENGELFKIDNPKDQSYFLFNIDYANLVNIILPLADYTKDEVRQMAKDANLPTHSKKDSQDICFIKTDYKDFIDGKIKNPKGMFVDCMGKVLGKHNGIANYTVGQRKGLGLGGFDRPLFVIKIDTENNNVIVGYQEELMQTVVMINDVNWLLPNAPSEAFDAMVKLRSRQKEVRAKITPLANNTAKIELYEPFAGIAPGQGACIYNNDKVIGGGFITNDN